MNSKLLVLLNTLLFHLKGVLLHSPLAFIFSLLLDRFDSDLV
jgi:hypothetical protein